MSQRSEKYNRNMERRVENLEETTEKVKRSLINHAPRLNKVESVVEGHTEKLWDIESAVKCEAETRRREHAYISRKVLRGQQEFERDMKRQWAGLLVVAVMAIVSMIAAAEAIEKTRADTETIRQTAAVTARTEVELLIAGRTGNDTWTLAAIYRAADNPLETEKIEAALLMQGYLSDAVPMSYEYQDYMRIYCHKYGCPYPLALAVADWETRGQFNMDTVGPNSEVGIMQLNPGPGGTYHAELEAATGLDPATPEGNIAGGCYKLGKYLAQYGDVTMTAMAYNMGQAGAEKAREAGITSTEYAEAVRDALEHWESTVNAWAGE